MALEPGSTAQRTGVPVTLVRDTYSNITAYDHNDGELLAATDSGAMFLYKSSSLVRLTDLHYDSVFPVSATPGQIWFTPDKARYYLTSNTCIEWSLGGSAGGPEIVDDITQVTATADDVGKLYFSRHDAKTYIGYSYKGRPQSASVQWTSGQATTSQEISTLLMSIRLPDQHWTNSYGYGDSECSVIISGDTGIVVGTIEYYAQGQYLMGTIWLDVGGLSLTLDSLPAIGSSASWDDVLSALRSGYWSESDDPDMDDMASVTWQNTSTTYYGFYSASVNNDYPIARPVRDGQLTIKLNGTTVQTFTANQSTNATANIQATPSRTTVALAGATPSVAAAANTDYTAGTLTSLTMTSVEISALEITFDFTVSSTGCTIDMPWQINADMVDLPEAGRRYILSIRGGIAVGVNVFPEGTITATTPVSISGTAGTAITATALTASASNGAGVQFSIDTLPAGISFTSGGVFSGTPTAAGTTTCTVTATAPECAPTTITVTITIS